MTDPTLEAANRAAHKVAGAAIRVREARERRQSCINAPAERTGYNRDIEVAEFWLDRALDEYEEAERRAQREATA